MTPGERLLAVTREAQEALDDLARAVSAAQPREEILRAIKRAKGPVEYALAVMGEGRWRLFGGDDVT